MVKRAKLAGEQARENLAAAISKLRQANRKGPSNHPRDVDRRAQQKDFAKQLQKIKDLLP